MRNLILAQAELGHVPSHVPGHCMSIDSDSGTVYFVSESGELVGYSHSQKKVFVFSQTLSLQAVLQLPLPRSSPPIGIQCLPSQEAICVATKSGEIILARMSTQEVEVVGEVDSGLDAMGWSPDQEIVMFVTHAGSLLCMTQDFDVLVESSMDVAGFGEQTPVSVGWGKAETQFRGTAGKLSASAVVATPLGLCGDDDGEPRIVWRGDGQFCATLVVLHGHRVLRVWARDGSLQATGQACDKLGASLAWRPDGALLAGVQVVGDRVDVVFFERNGLRHGEFALPIKAGQGTVTALEWNADSTVLMVCVADGDAARVLLWTSGNYHWCVHEI